MYVVLPTPDAQKFKIFRITDSFKFGQTYRCSKDQTFIYQTILEDWFIEH